jgi:hypothetical protein
MSPQDARFDWVKERAKCSLGSMFDALSTAVEQDVQSVKDLQRAVHDSKNFFEFKRDRNVFRVNREKTNALEPPSAVTFTLSANEITVESPDEAAFSVIPALNEDGKCKLTVSGKELEIWQVCQMALGRFFFGAPELGQNRIEIW